MSWHGKQYPKAMRDHRANKRRDAEDRDGALSAVDPRRKTLRVLIDRLEAHAPGSDEPAAS